MRTTALTTLLLVFSGCDGDDQPEPFFLGFAAVVDGHELGCTDTLTAFGPSGEAVIGLNDLRIYISNLRFTDGGGGAVELTLDDNEFQYNGPEGAVTLIDLTANTEGSWLRAGGPIRPTEHPRS